MSVIDSGGKFILDSASEEHIKKLANDALKQNHADEHQELLRKFRDIVYIQEVASLKKFLEIRHPEQVNQIYRLREILNHQRVS